MHEALQPVPVRGILESFRGAVIIISRFQLVFVFIGICGDCEQAALLTSRADEATASAALAVAESKLSDVEEELKEALSNLEDASRRAVEAAELTAEAQVRM